MALRDRFLGLAGWLGRGLRLAAARFPVAALAILAISVLSNLSVRRSDVMDPVDFAWLLAALVTGGAASVGAVLVAEGRDLLPAPTQALSLAVGLAIGLLVWFGEPLGLFVPALIAASLLLVPLAPFAPRAGRDDLAFWSFTLWSAVGGTLAFLSVLLFVLGVSAILEMIRFLFEVGLSSDAYEHIFLTAFTLVGPLFALGQVPRADEAAAPLVEEDRLARSVRVLFDWVATPLALATAVVLHLYAAKIVLQGALPVGEIGWIVTFYALLLLSLRIAVAPYVVGGAAPTRLLARWWWALLLVPLGLLALAVSLRVSAEGWTSERYYLALGGLSAAICIALQAVPRLRGSIVVLALVPCLALLVSSAPPLGVGAVVARSQAGLVAQRFAPGGVLARGDALDGTQLDELRSRLSALDEVGGLGAVAPLVEEPALRERLAASSWTGEDDALQALLDAKGLAYASYATGPVRLILSAAVEGAVETAGFDRLVPALVAETAAFASQPPFATIPGVPRLGLDETGLVVTLHGATDRFDLGAALRALPDSVFSGDPTLTTPPAIDLTSASGRRLRLALTFLDVAPDRTRPSGLRAALLYRAADWPPAPSLGGDGRGDPVGGGGDGAAGEPGGAVGESPR